MTTQWKERYHTLHHGIRMDQRIHSTTILIQRLLIQPRISRLVLRPVPLIPTPLMRLGRELLLRLASIRAVRASLEVDSVPGAVTLS